eukprot:5518161-Amphidinium_carterae.2
MSGGLALMISCCQGTVQSQVNMFLVLCVTALEMQVGTYAYAMEMVQGINLLHLSLITNPATSQPLIGYTSEPLLIHF